jgi:hypothetical protein
MEEIVPAYERFAKAEMLIIVSLKLLGILSDPFQVEFGPRKFRRPEVAWQRWALVQVERPVSQRQPNSHEEQAN